MPGTIPNPTPVYRLIHIDNLAVCLQRSGLNAPNNPPQDGLDYRTIHREDVQLKLRITAINCGPRGTVHDYVPFYFGYLSPMLLQLKTGQVVGYGEGQEPLIYLVSSCQAVQAAGAGFAFSDGHGLAGFTEWFDDLAHLDKVDWDMVYQRYWADSPEDMDRQRRKQAEFLVHRFCPWSLIQEIGVLGQATAARVEAILGGHAPAMRRPVLVRPEWYYHA